jgi:hypothetical protein
MIFMNFPNSSNRIRPLGFAQPLTEMGIRDRKMFLVSGARPVRETDLAAICEPTV